MAYDWTYIDDCRVEVSIAQRYWLLKAAFEAAFPGLTLYVSDGTRTWQQQYDLWHAYVTGASSIRAAHPDDPQAYHVETNPIGPKALDIRDSGEDAGVTRYGNSRSDWIRDNARRFGFVPRGYEEFNEPWHLEGTLAATASDGGIDLSRPLDEDGDLGRQTVAKLQSVLDVTPDGDLGPETVKALQQRLHVSADGDLGPETVTALQLAIGLSGSDVDGNWGSGTTR